MVQVFISWSGQSSKELAVVLHSWLPNVLQAVKPWMSDQDIAKGDRWGRQLEDKLASTTQGIVCVTPANQAAPWLNYEAGSLAKAVEQRTKVHPLLLGLSKTELKGPLGRFQATPVTDRLEVFKMIESLNHDTADPLPSDKLQRAFNSNWEDLLTEVRAIVPERKADQPTDRDLLEEILATVRRIPRQPPEANPSDRRDPDDFPQL